MYYSMSEEGKTKGMLRRKTTRIFIDTSKGLTKDESHDIENELKGTNNDTKMITHKSDTQYTENKPMVGVGFEQGKNRYWVMLADQKKKHFKADDYEDKDEACKKACICRMKYNKEMNGGGLKTFRSSNNHPIEMIVKMNEANYKLNY
jgi:hypothetical protein